MNNIKFKLENGSTVDAFTVTIDFMYEKYNQIKPANTFYAWIDALHENGIITKLETENRDNIAIHKLFY